jgi:hypothetical protein
MNPIYLPPRHGRDESAELRVSAVRDVDVPWKRRPSVREGLPGEAVWNEAIHPRLPAATKLQDLFPGNCDSSKGKLV